MSKVMKVWLVLASVVLLALLPYVGPASHWFGFAGPSKAEQAKTKAEKQAQARQLALDDFYRLRNTVLDGVGAGVTVDGIKRTLRFEGLSLDAIGTNNDELLVYVQRGYEFDARNALNSLRQLKANPNTAEKLRTSFLEAQQKSGKPLMAFVANMNVVNELVARNYIGAAAAQGVAVSPGSLRQQGQRVGTYIKPSPKHAKAPTKKPVAKKTPAKTRTRTRVHK